MSSYRTRFDDRPTLTRLGGSAGGSSLLGDVGRLRLVRDADGDSHAALACAAAPIEQVEEEIDHLWFDSMKRITLRCRKGSRRSVTHCNAPARLLEPDNAIG